VSSNSSFISNLILSVLPLVLSPLSYIPSSRFYFYSFLLRASSLCHSIFAHLLSHMPVFNVFFTPFFWIFISHLSSASYSSHISTTYFFTHSF
jgi:hypothetical protein